MIDYSLADEIEGNALTGRYRLG